ncbi:MAG TPA: tetratricopeptide repeat protein [Porticoccus sp.]|nr:tetratricopeptide repeat protein [Porticoccus sp.]
MHISMTYFSQAANYASKHCARLILIALLALGGCTDQQTDNAELAKNHLITANAYFQQGQFRAAIIEARNVIKYAPNSADGYVTLAKIYNQLGNTASSVTALESILDKYPEAVNLTLAEAYILSGKFVSAQQLLEKSSNKQNNTYRLLQARTMAGLKKHQQAITLFEQVLASDPNNLDAQLGIIRTSLTDNRLADAQTAITRLLEQNSQSSEVLFLSAQIAYMENDLEGTEKFLSDALSYLPQSDVITPLKSKILRQLAGILTQTGRSSEALIYSKILAEANPEAHRAEQKFNEALSLYRAGNLQEAEKLLLDLYEQHPNNNLSGLLLGMVNYQQGDMSEAEGLLEKNIDIETASTMVISSTALAQIRLQQPEKAEKLLSSALETRPDDPGINAIYGLAILSTDAKDVRGAIALQKALALDPSRAKLHLVLARHYLALEKPEQAYAQFNSALSKTPNDPAIQNNYLRALLQNQDNDQAIKLSQQFMDQSPNDPSVYILAASVSLALKDKDNAEKYFRKAVALDNNNTTAIFSLGQLNLANEQWAQAETNFRKVIVIAPLGSKAYKGLISSFEARKDGDKIITELTASANAENANHTLLTVLAEYYARQSNIDKAEAYIDKAISLNNEDSYTQSIAISIYRTLSSQYLADKDIALARQKLGKAAVASFGRDFQASSS